MQVDVITYGYASRSSGPARPSVWRRMVDRLRTVGTTYELDDHLARDIGARHYTVPVFRPAEQGDWR